MLYISLASQTNYTCVILKFTPHIYGTMHCSTLSQEYMIEIGWEDVTHPSHMALALV